MTTPRIRVLVVDDSVLVREALAAGLAAHPDLEVVGVAADAYEARDQIVHLRPHVITLDVQMPRMDGVTFLRKLMRQYPLPVVMVSSLTQRGAQATLDALDAGAVDFVAKPTSGGEGLEGVIDDIAARVRRAATVDVARPRSSPAAPPRALAAGVRRSGRVIVMGASTGGTLAVRTILQGLPPTMPGIVVVQHMPAGFTRAFAERLDAETGLTVKEAATGDRILPGRVLVAPGGVQLRLERAGGALAVVCEGEDRVSGHAPSVDVAMASAARAAGSGAVGVLLTGMGRDGAQGMAQLRQAGAATIGQDEASCVVYGMPRAARQLGAVEAELPLDAIAAALVERIEREAPERA